MPKCFKHREREAYAKWRVCADGPWKNVCLQCDIELNELGLKWGYPRSYKTKLRAYIKKVNRENQTS